MNPRRFLSFLVLACASMAVNAEDFSGKVIAVMDGDTLLVLRVGHPVKIRLAEVDAPEKAQPYGGDSQKSLAEMTLGKQVQVASRAVDSYGRLVATLHVGEVNVNHAQVQRGLAWEYSRFHSNRELVSLQREAQQAKRGLWAEDGAVEPSQWRKLHPADFAVVSPGSVTGVADGSGSAFQKETDPACARKNCSEIGSCEEAKRRFLVCGQKSLDGDVDGKPCENLCAAERAKAAGSR